MSFTCIVCLDLLTNIPPKQPAGQQQIDYVVTKCGHLFHNECLREWVNQQKSPFMQCPKCQQPVEANDNIILWPDQDAETDECNERVNRMRNLSSIKDKLQTENQKLKISLEDAEILNDIMRYEYEDLHRKRNAELLQVQANLKDEKNIFDVKEMSSKDEISRLQRIICQLEGQLKTLQVSYDSTSRRHVEELKLRDERCKEYQEMALTLCSTLNFVTPTLNNENSLHTLNNNGNEPRLTKVQRIGLEARVLQDRLDRQTSELFQVENKVLNPKNDPFIEFDLPKSKSPISAYVQMNNSPTNLTPPRREVLSPNCNNATDVFDHLNSPMSNKQEYMAQPPAENGVHLDTSTMSNRLHEDPYFNNRYINSDCRNNSAAQNALSIDDSDMVTGAGPSPGVQNENIYPASTLMDVIKERLKNIDHK